MIHRSVLGSSRHLVLILLVLLQIFSSPITASPFEEQEQDELYGVDVSWPMQEDEHLEFTAAVRYHKFLQACAQHSSKELCQRNEDERLALNRKQPPQMTNFTTLGYAKVPIPEHAWTILSKFWKQHKPPTLSKEKEQQSKTSKTASTISEEWAPGSTYVNHWEAKTSMTNIHTHMPASDVRTMERAVQGVLEHWSGISLVPTSIYGIRTYHRGSLLAPHVDRLPLVLSAILHVAHDGGGDDDDEQQDESADTASGSSKGKDVEEWPLQVIGHDGVAANITLQPGEMILYESHSVIHGRPYPLQSEYYANLFVHFEPVGYTQSLYNDASNDLQQQHQEEKDNDDAEKDTNPLATLFQTLLNRAEPTIDAPSSPPNLPPYTLTDEEATRWRQDYTFVRTQADKETKPRKTPGATNAHALAAGGLLEKFKEAVKDNPDLLDKSDTNGWKPIHEAARGGHTKVLQYMIEKGANVNERTNDGRGATPLWWTMQYFPDNHPAVELLRRHGALPLPPRGHQG